MALKIPPDFDVKAVPLDVNERWIRDGLVLRIDNWAIAMLQVIQILNPKPRRPKENTHLHGASNTDLRQDRPTSTR